ncbi:ABC transporter substrate-binding protein [Actinoallomurus acaciae]|uniref:ABC transporter substrate-binding protein n=1 Tax=Actinoallomurus acaciae TaxID=502577 RepID=A0ABV5Y8Q7_9ACTN
MSGASLTVGIGAAPGNLDPQRSVNGPNLLLGIFAYDTPVTLLDSGRPAPQVVTSWKPGKRSYSLTVRPGVTCSDGSPMDAKTVADNINYVADPKHGSPMAGVAVPSGATAKSDAAGVVHVSLPSDAPFFMQNLAELPLVCQAGLRNRKMLAGASSGSGPYVLSKAVPGDNFTYTLRKGYTWGPNGASTSAVGMPEKLTFKVVTSPTTTANLLLNGQLNISQISGSDTTRLKSAGVFSAGSQFIGQELAFNESRGEAGSDVAVRRALIADLDLTDLAKVDSGGGGKRANGLIADPKICAGDTMTGSVPNFDPNQAKAMLDQAGWVAGPGGIRHKDGAALSISLIFANEEPTTAATAEYIATQWKKLGVDVKLNEQSFDQTSAVVFGKGAWGATLIGLGVSNPATLVPFFSSPSPTAGNNFGHFANAQYDDLVRKAASQDGTAGCPDWNAAESALFKDADITPISTKPLLYWGKKAKFQVIAHVLIPTSIRALAG